MIKNNIYNILLDEIKKEKYILDMSQAKRYSERNSKTKLRGRDLLLDFLKSMGYTLK